MPAPEAGRPRQQIAPPLKNTQYINTPVNISPRDPDAVREISFITSPVEQYSFTLSGTAQVSIAGALIAEMTNDEKRELLADLAPGIEVAAAVPEGLKTNA